MQLEETVGRLAGHDRQTVNRDDIVLNHATTRAAAVSRRRGAVAHTETFAKKGWCW